MSTVEAAGPGRPRQFDTDATIERAVALFWNKGYRATTTRDLQDALGLGASSIYNSFGSKEALLQRALDRYEEEATRALILPLQSAGGGIDAIERFLHALQSWVCQQERRGCLLTNLVIEDANEPEWIARRSRAYRRRLRAELERVLEIASQQKELNNATSAAQRADLLIAVVLGINVFARSPDSDREVASIIESAIAEIRSWALF